MGWNSVVFPLVLVVSGAPNTGLFVYNGVPAKGNLVGQIVAPGTTRDPFGNTVGAVANFGIWSASTGAFLQHFGVDRFGNTYLANAAGLTVQHGASGDGSQRYYNAGGAALGNLVAVISPAAGTDAVGNAYPLGINFGKWSGAGALLQHFGVDQNGDTFLVNAAGLTVVREHSADGSIWFYNSSGEGLHNLLDTIAPAAGTDLTGNPYYAGVVNYLTSAGVVTAVAQLLNGALRVGTPAQIAGTSSKQPGTVSLLNVIEGVLNLLSGANGVTDTQASMALTSQNNTGINVPLIGFAHPLQLQNIGVIPGQVAGSALLFCETTGNMQVRAGGDGNTYDTERLTLRTSGGTISSAAFGTVGGLTKNVAAGEYHFRAHLNHVDNGAGAAAAALYRMISPPFTQGSLDLTGMANGPLVSVRFDNASGFGTSLAAPVVTPGSGVRHSIVIEGDAIFTAPGTLAVQAAINAAGAAQFVIANGGTLTIEPVVAS